MRRLLGAVAVMAAIAIVVGVIIVDGSSSDERDATATATANSEAATKATAAFFAGYVSADGRVVRHDEGGDTVSEGQAYAMLLAATANDRVQFERVWSWTRLNLQRPDGLFSWRWRAGRVDDVNPASDADLDIAAALLVAASKFGEQSMAAEARRIASAVIEHETVEVANKRILVAGPWAVADRIVNPSYVARCDFGEFERATSDPRWAQVRASSRELIGPLVEQGLPPDWIVVDNNGAGHPIDGPEARQGAGRYGLDAARVPARLAGCDDGRPVAAALWARLQTLERDGAAISYAIDGRRLSDDEHPLGVVASALAAHAADDDGEATRRMEVAQQLEDRHSPYYGSAWLALGTTTMASVDGGTAPRRGAARVGGLRFAVLGAAAQGTTVPPTTPATAPPTTPTTAPSTTPTTAPPTTPTTAPPTTPTTVTTSRPSTTRAPATTSRPPTTVTTQPSVSTRPVTTAGPASTPSLSTAPQAEAGDLSASPEVLPGLQRRQGQVSSDAPTAHETSRRRTGALTIGGLSAVAVLGAWLGLRERHIIRNRPPRASEAPGL
jgi:endoglucanase